MDTHGEYVWKIRSAECGVSGFARLPAVMNLLQEAASLNAKELGFSKSDFSAHGENVSWALTRIRVCMERYPRWEEETRIVTWPRLGRRITAFRDFEIFGASGTRIGAAASEWMAIDLASRRAVPVPAGVAALANDERPPVFGDAAFSRLRREDGLVPVASAEFRARRGDIDLNGHVNNVHYIEWLLETVPEGLENCRELEAVFKAETLVGDTVLAECMETAPGEFLHCISSASGGGDRVLARTVFRDARREVRA